MRVATTAPTWIAVLLCLLLPMLVPMVVAGRPGDDLVAAGTVDVRSWDYWCHEMDATLVVHVTSPTEAIATLAVRPTAATDASSCYASPFKVVLHRLGTDALTLEGDWENGYRGGLSSTTIAPYGDGTAIQLRHVVTPYIVPAGTWTVVEGEFHDTRLG